LNLTYSLLLAPALLIGGILRRRLRGQATGADAAPHLLDIFAADFDSDAL